MSRRAGALIKTSASLMKIRRRMCQNGLEIALLFRQPFFLDSRKNLSAWRRARRDSRPLRENEAGFFRRLPRRCAPRNDEKSVGFQQAYLLLPSHLYCHCERSEAISSCTFKLKPYSAPSCVPSIDVGCLAIHGATDPRRVQRRRRFSCSILTRSPPSKQ